MPIFDDIPKVFYPCRENDVYSDHNRRGACNWHGGIDPNAQPVELGKGSRGASAGIALVPLNKIYTNPEWFQNRAKPFSLRSVDNIVQAAKDGNFNWENFDAVTLWRNPADGKNYVISGHSRTEAFDRLCRLGVTVAGRDFCAIPAKVNITWTLEQAQKAAFESNTLATKETALERALYYRRLRLQEGQAKKELQEVARRLEGNNANAILAFSYLNPEGRTWNALMALEGKDKDTVATLQTVGRWIGNARATIPQLTDRHENELYAWLIDNKAYGTGAGRISNEREFQNRLRSIINRRTEFGELAESLNIQNFVQKSPVEQQFDRQLTAARDQVRDLEKQLKAKIRELSARGASESDVQRITEPIEATLRRARLEYQRLMQKRSDVAEAARSEMSLFAGFGAIVDTKPPGKVMCLDGTYSTAGPVSGACSYHGGWTGKGKAEKKAAKTNEYMNYELAKKLNRDPNKHIVIPTLPEHQKLLSDLTNNFIPIDGVSRKQRAYAEDLRKREIEKSVEMYFLMASLAYATNDKEDIKLVDKVLDLLQKVSEADWSARQWIDTAKGRGLYSNLEIEAARRLEKNITGLSRRPAAGKRFVHFYTDQNGRRRKVSYGQAGSTIRPGTDKGNAYCARSYGQMKQYPKAAKNPNSPLRLSRKKWKCRGKKSVI